MNKCPKCQSVRLKTYKKTQNSYYGFYQEDTIYCQNCKREFAYDAKEDKWYDVDEGL